jgi:hypothetical protein
MPKIPQGKFRTEASTRVESAKPLQLKSVSKPLKDFGNMAGQIGKQMEKAETRVKSMEYASDGEKEFNDKELPVIESLFGMSKGGFIKKGTELPDGSVMEQDTELEKVVSSRVETFNNRYMAGQSDPEKAAMFGKYVADRGLKQVAKAKTFAKNQVTKDTFNSAVSQGTLLTERMVDGDAGTEDYNKYMQKMDDLKPVIGEDNYSKIVKGFHQSLGSKADQIALYHPDGLSKAKIAEANSVIGRLDDAIQRRQKIESTRTRTTRDKIVSSVNTPMELRSSAKQVQDSKNYLLNSPLPEWENGPQRVSDYGKIEGKSLAITVMGQVGDMETSNPMFSNAVAEALNKSVRGLASTSMMEYASEEEVKKAVMDNFNVEMARLDQQRKNDPREFQKGFMPSMEMQLSKNRPEEVVPQLIESQQNYGIATDNVRLTSNQDIKNDAKLFKGWREGMDKDGVSFMGYVNQQQQRWGVSAGKALLESASKGGVDASTFYAVGGSDDFRQQLGMGHGSFKKNLEKLGNKKMLASSMDKILKRGSVETRLMNQVKETVEDELSNVDGLYFGVNGDARYDGYIKSIAYIAANRAANDDSLDVSDAIQESVELMKEEFPTATDGANMISVPKAYAKNFGIETDKLNDMLSSAKEMKHLSGMGIELDAERLAASASKNPVLAEKMQAVLGKGYDKEAQFEAFVEAMGDSLKVAPDPNNPTNIKFYAKDPKTQKMSQIPVIMNGQTEPLSVPIKDYYNQYNKESINTFGKGMDKAGDYMKLVGGGLDRLMTTPESAVGVEKDLR